MKKFIRINLSMSRLEHQLRNGVMHSIQDIVQESQQSDLPLAFTKVNINTVVAVTKSSIQFFGYDSKLEALQMVGELKLDTSMTILGGRVRIANLIPLQTKHQFLIE